MRKTVVAGNWKMNMLPSQVEGFINKLKGNFKNDRDIVLCTPFTHLTAALAAVEDTDIAIGAQNLHYEEKGAFTGEISGQMLKDLGVQYVIVGHSERRELFKETDETINKKVLAALNAGLIPIVCVGEKLEQREQNITIELVRSQTKIALQKVDAAQAKRLIIAYEPVWAIGTGLTATNAQAEEVCAAIRELICEIYGKAVADEIRIQYGGSVNEANAAELFAMENIDGGLVGGASLKEEFTKL